MYCHSEAILLNDVYSATAVYADAVDEMLELAGTGKEAAFQEKARFAATTLMNLRHARVRLYCHEKQHHCKVSFGGQDPLNRAAFEQYNSLPL